MLVWIETAIEEFDVVWDAVLGVERWGATGRHVTTGCGQRLH